VQESNLHMAVNNSLVAAGNSPTDYLGVFDEQNADVRRCELVARAPER